jgi:hypothetical protein
MHQVKHCNGLEPQVAIPLHTNKPQLSRGGLPSA